MKLHVIFQRIAVQIVVVTLLVCVVSCKKDTKGTDIIRNGKWQGSYKTVNTSDAIIFNVKDGKITSDGSTISDFSGRICCMWVKIYWPSTTSIHTETSFLQDIPVSDNSFSVGSSIGEIVISGTFSSGNVCTGKVIYQHVTYGQPTGYEEYVFNAEPLQ